MVLEIESNIELYSWPFLQKLDKNPTRFQTGLKFSLPASVPRVAEVIGMYHHTNYICFLNTFY